MEEKLISFETATLAFEKGFPQEPNKLRVPYYNYKGEIKGDVTEWLKRHLKKEDTTGYENVSAPTQSLLQKWLREIHNIEFDIIVTKIGENKKSYDIFVIDTSKFEIKQNKKVLCSFFNFKNYEEALEKGLQEALKQIK